MSAQAGIFYFDRRPVPADAATRLLASLRDYGPDDRGAIVRPGLVMVHQAMHVSAEDTLERQPLCAGTDTVLTWDGRLDTREDLLALGWNDLSNKLSDDPSSVPSTDLSPADAPPVSTTTDAALALAVLTRDGVPGLRRLIGDWSLAHTDGETLLLASDFAGNRPLFYRVGPEAVHWSTSLAELVSRLGLEDALERRYLAGFLTGMMPPELTPYAGVRAVRPAHALTWTRDRRETRTCFWSPPANRIRYRDELEYDAHLRHLFSESVRGRLRSTRVAFAELSGGLDSSAVCCMASLLTRTGLAETPEVKALSATSERSPESDESRFITAVQEHCGLDVRRTAYERAFGLTDTEHGWIAPTQPSDMGLLFLRTVAAEGGRTLLTGHPGDLVMGNVPDRGLLSLEIWQEESAAAWLRYCRAWSRQSKEPIWSLLQTLMRYAGPAARHAARGGSLERALAWRLADELRAHGAEDTRDVDRAVSQAFSLRAPLGALWREEVARRLRVTLTFERASRRAFVENLQLFTDTRLLESPAAFARVRQTHPFMHRPLVEFALSIPGTVLQGAGEPRRLMRRAFAGFMPPRILRRFSKGYASPLIMRDLRTIARDWLPDIDRLHIVQQEIADPALLRQRFTEVRDGAARRTANLRELVLLERWFRLRERRREGTKDDIGATEVRS